MEMNARAVLFDYFCVFAKILTVLVSFSSFIFCQIG